MIEYRSHDLSDSRVLLAGLLRKQQAVADVIAGRSSLVDAAVQFREADRGQPDGEAACRSVIGWVHLSLIDRPVRAEQVAGRLEHELQNYQARFGDLPLPV